MELEVKIAQALFRINGVGFSPRNPITFTSGLKAPLYIDNRKFPFWPEEWRLVIEGFAEKIREENIAFDVIAGIEAAGIPHSSALAYSLKKPSVFVRKKPKEHATGKRIEGGDVSGKKVLIIEDLVTTGGSSLEGVEALRKEGAEVSDCLVVVNYGFPESKEAFEKSEVRLHPLASVITILQEAQTLGKITQEETIMIQNWLRDPQEWAQKYGFSD